MTEPDVLYSDVKFTKRKENNNASSSTEATYSEVRISTTQPASEEPGSPPQAVSNGGSKVTSERVALVVLSALLAAAVVALGVTSYKNIQTMESLQKLTDEHEAVTKNLTVLEESCNTVQPTCPQLTEVNPDEPCPVCDEGWEAHGEKCYYFSTDISTWINSRDECRRLGGDLVKIDSTDKQSFLERRLRDKMNEPEDKFWIGLTDSKEEGKWLWADDSPLGSLTFWSGTEPDNWKGEHGNNTAGEDCVRMGETYGATDLKCWFDNSCEDPQRRICEKNKNVIYVIR